MIKKVKFYLVVFILIESSLSYTNNMIYPDLNLTSQIGNKRKLISGSLFTPIYQNDNNLIFSDIRLSNHILNSNKNLDADHYNECELNLGFGYRKILPDEQVLGSAIYYDIRKSLYHYQATFNQIVINTHFLSANWQYHLNGYFPIGNKNKAKSSKNFTSKAYAQNNNVFFQYDYVQYTQKPLYGGDIKITYAKSNFDNLRYGGLIYYFNNSKSKLNKHVIGSGISLDYQLNSIVQIKTSLTYDKLRQVSALAGIKLNIPLNKKIKKYNKTQQLLAAPVERDIDIVIAKEKHTLNKSYELQSDHFALSPSTMLNSTNQNLSSLNHIEKAVNNRAKIVIVDDGEFNYNQVQTITPEHYLQNVSLLTQLYVNEFRNGTKTIDEVIEKASSLPAEQRIFQIFAAQKAYQQITNSTNYYLAGMQISSAQLKDIFYNKYSALNHSANQIYKINLPGYGNVEVERGGIIWITKNNGQQYIVLGSDSGSLSRNNNDPSKAWSAWFSGQGEVVDGNFKETIVREAFEESAGEIALTYDNIDQAITDKRFFYHPIYKILTIVIADPSGTVDASYLNNKLITLKNNFNVPPSMQEVGKYFNIKANDFINFANNMKNPSLNFYSNDYQIPTANNNVIRMDRYYGRSLGDGNSITAIRNGLNLLP